MGKKKRGGAERDVDLNAMLVVSLFIIILAFFILLNAIAVVDEERKLSALGSLLESFGILSGGFSNLEGDGVNLDLSTIQAMTSMVDFTDLYQEETSGAKDLYIKTSQRGTVLRVSSEVLFDRPGTVVKPVDYAIIVEKTKKIFSIPASELFEGENTEIKSGADELLDRVSKTILNNDLPVEIVGHTDNMPPENRYMTNREISSIRALNVLKYLTTKNNVPADRLTAYGWGKYHPEYSNSTQETRAYNKRIDIVFYLEPSMGKPEGGFTFKNFFFRVFE
ncbi:MAG: OmpA family protein [Desulfobacterales bacterium]|nr:OmpA family protein [Desulfobacterales bacterium]